MEVQYKKLNSKKENQKIKKKKDFRFLNLTFNFAFLYFNLLPFLFLIILLIPGIIALLHPGFPTTDDGSWMIIRFSAFYDALRHGQFPVRFLPRLNHGYGYPVADFLYPLFMYLAVPLHLVKVSDVNSIKIILIASFLLSSIFCYLWLSRVPFDTRMQFRFKPLPAFVGALVYGLFPYHLYDMYQRGSVGEVLALCIVPFILWQIERSNLVFISLGIALLILSHNTLALLFLPVIIVYMYLSWRGKGFAIPSVTFRNELKTSSSKKNLTAVKEPFRSGLQTRSGVWFLVFSILLGLGLSAFFWIPALYDKQFTVFDLTKVSDYSQYFLSKTSFGILGFFSIVIIILSVALLIRKNQKMTLFFFLLTLISIFLASSYFGFLWNITPLPQLVQFPFRFLSVAILGIAYISAAVLAGMKSRISIGIAVVMIVLLASSSWSYLFPKSYQVYPDGYYATNEDTTTVKNEYMPRWVKIIPLQSPSNSVIVHNGTGSVTNINDSNPNKISFTAILDNPATIQINRVYFPGWKLQVLPAGFRLRGRSDSRSRQDSQYKAISYNNKQGVIEVSLPQGTYQVMATFGETGVRLLADFVSLVALVIIIGIPIFKRYKNPNN